MMKNRIMAIVTSICMLIAMMPMGMAYAEDENPKGQIGENVFWELDGGVMTVSGTGPTYDYLTGVTYDGYAEVSNRGFEEYIEDIRAIYIEDGITSIGSGLFSLNNDVRFSSLTSVQIADTVTSIGDFAFFFATSLQTVAIPDSVVSIGDSAFNNCCHAESLYIGAGLEKIGDKAFYEMFDLRELYVDDENKYYQEYHGMLFNNASPQDPTELILCPMTRSGELSLPYSVEVLGKDSLAGCQYLTEIDLPANLKIIREDAFFYCKNVEKMDLPDKLEVIEKDGLSDMYKLKNITIPPSVKQIGTNAFSGITHLNLTFEGDAPEFVAEEGKFSFIGNYLPRDMTVNIDCMKSGWSNDMFDGFIEDITLVRKHSTMEDSLEATCVENGYALNYVCKGCDQHFTDEEGLSPIDDFDAWKVDDANRIDALGHQFKNWKIGEYPTCTSKGAIFRICGRCGEIESKRTDKLPHDIIRVDARGASCTEDGNIEYYMCNECGKYFSDAEGTSEISKNDVIIAAYGHDYDKGTITRKASVGKEGSVKYTCSACKASYTAKIPAIKSLSLSKSSYTYSGKGNKPAVTVVDGDGHVVGASSYAVTYDKNIEAGKAFVNITFKGDYEGSKTLSFTINPKKASIYSAAGKKKLTVKMKTKVSSTGGATYQIAYKQKGKSKWKYTTTTKQSKVIKKLKKGKRYYVKVRAYKKVGSTKYYGAWSKTKLSKKIK